MHQKSIYLVPISKWNSRFLYRISANNGSALTFAEYISAALGSNLIVDVKEDHMRIGSVSYTHLTLPTICSV
mgnify:CR=1 FL=1